ncbi:hypothetical protein ACFUEM_38435 [Streptomyces anulatus]|uniref:ATP-dependent DNA ligase n=1 Tax=Streptomyces anulatus TaxID=1892 RepID=UPI0035D9FDE4
MLAQARDTIPSAGALRGGLVMDLKWDGYRAIAFSSARSGGLFLLQTRRGSLVQDRFPDLAAAAVQLPPGLVLDGELLVLNSSGIMDFEALQQRAVSTTPRTVKTLAKAHPAYFVAFDILQLGGQPILAEPYEQRRSRLEALFGGHGLSPPWTLCRSTRDPAVAQEWLETWTRTPGVEGVLWTWFSTDRLTGAQPIARRSERIVITVLVPSPEGAGRG